MTENLNHHHTAIYKSVCSCRFLSLSDFCQRMMASGLVGHCVILLLPPHCTVVVAGKAQDAGYDAEIWHLVRMGSEWSHVTHLCNAANMINLAGTAVQLLLYLTYSRLADSNSPAIWHLSETLFICMHKVKWVLVTVFMKQYTVSNHPTARGPYFLQAEPQCSKPDSKHILSVNNC